MSQINVQFWESAFNKKGDIVNNRDSWGGRLGFLAACIGSAVGLSNLCNLVYVGTQYQGGLFLIPYIFSILIIAIPMFILEISVGKMFKSGPLSSYIKLNKRFGGIGIFTLLSSYFILTFYVVFVSRMLVYPLASLNFNPKNYLEAKLYFKNFLGYSKDKDGINTISFKLFIGLLAIWSSFYFIMVRGVKSMSKIFVYTLPVCLFISLMFLCLSFSYENSMLDLQKFFGNWNKLEQLADPHLWLECLSRVFFSSGVTLGVITTYSSYSSIHQNAVKDSIIVNITNFLFELIFAVTAFCIIGNIDSIRAEDINASWLAFTIYPISMSTLPAAWMFKLLFYFSQLLLGLTSAAGLYEMVVTAFYESHYIRSKVNKNTLYLLISASSFLIGVIYISDIGTNIINTMAIFLTEIFLIIIGLMETLAVGWLYNHHKVVKSMGKWRFYVLFFGYIFSIVLSILLFFIQNSTWVYTGVPIAMISLLVIGLLIFNNSQSFTSNLKTIIYRSCGEFQQDINCIYKIEGKQQLSKIWCILIRWIIPAILIIILPSSFLDIVKNYKEADNFIRKMAFSFGVIVSGFGFFLLIGYFFLPRYAQFWLPELKNRNSIYHFGETSLQEDETDLFIKSS